MNQSRLYSEQKISESPPAPLRCRIILRAFFKSPHRKKKAGD